MTTASLRFNDKEHSVLHWALTLYDLYFGLPEEDRPIRLPELPPAEQEEACVMARDMRARAQRSRNKKAGF